MEMKIEIPDSYKKKLKAMTKVVDIFDEIDLVNKMLGNSSNMPKSLKRNLMMRRVFLYIRGRQIVDERHDEIKAAVERIKQYEERE